MTTARRLRQKATYLQNDHKSLMDKIEKELHCLHEMAAGDRDSTETPASRSNHETVAETPAENGHHMHNESELLHPFAVADTVEAGSPAGIAGVSAGDKVLRFGSATSQTLPIKETGKYDLSSLRGILQNSMYRSIAVVVQRGEAIIETTLTPGMQNGNPVLG